MNNQQQILAKITENIDKFLGLINKIQDKEISQPLNKLFDTVGARLATAPLSTKTEYHGAYTGGLVQNALLVTKTMSELNKACEANLPISSIILTGLFHNIGKVGDLNNDYLIPLDSNWHNERGIMFDFNKEISFIPPQMRSIWWLNSHKVPMSAEEINAILSVGSMNNISDIDFYRSPMLAIILQQAIRSVAIKTSGKRSVLE